MANFDHAIYRTVDPAGAPAVIGQHYFNTTNGKHWISQGTSGLTDWILQKSESQIDHVNILNKGTRTHAEIDIHLNITSGNPHGVNAGHVGNTVAQWNANKIHGRDISNVAPNTGEALMWNGTTIAFANPSTSADQLVKVSATDSTSDYLTSKVVIAGAITKSILNPAGNEQIQIGLDQTAIDHVNLLNKGTKSHATIDSDITTLQSNVSSNTTSISTLTSTKADKTNVLEKDNVTSYTPTLDNHPATKKYVDDNAGGLKTNSPVEVLPLIASVFYPLGAQNASATGTIVGVANLCQIHPVIWPESGVATDFSIACTTLVAGGNVKIVIYDTNANGEPTTLLFESANLSTAATGVKTIAANATSFVKGKLYWVGVRFSNATNAIRALPLAGVMTVGGASGTISTTFGTVIRRTITFANAAPNPWVYSSAEITQGILPAAVYLRS